jgi:hypothetical protein
VREDMGFGDIPSRIQTIADHGVQVGRNADVTRPPRTAGSDGSD